jgi:general nucleoside transport system permease protein
MASVPASRTKHRAWQSTAVTVLTSALAVVIALLAGAMFILASGDDPIEAYRALWDGAFGSRRAIGETLAAATPYIFGGLAFAVAFRSGMFNIGIEGQMVMGGLAAGLFAGADLGLPSIVYVPTAMALALIAGGIWGAIAGVLKAVSGAHEVITTIMLNYLAFRILSYVLLETEDYLPVNAQLQATDLAPSGARLPIILDGTRLHAGFLVGLVTALVIWVMLFRTNFGYHLRTVGLSRGAAAYAGISWGATVIAAMFVSGGLAGLGGGSETIGLLHLDSSRTCRPQPSLRRRGRCVDLRRAAQWLECDAKPGRHVEGDRAGIAGLRHPGHRRACRIEPRSGVVSPPQEGADVGRRLFEHDRRRIRHPDRDLVRRGQRQQWMA